MPTPTKVMNVLGVQKGTTDPDRCKFPAHVDVALTEAIEAQLQGLRARAAAMSMWSVPAPKLAISCSRSPASAIIAASILSVTVGTSTSAVRSASARSSGAGTFSGLTVSGRRCWAGT